MLRRSRYRPAARRREACQPARPRRVGRRDYIQRPSRVCRKTYAERSVGVRRKAPGAHAESQQMSTGRTRVRGVTKRKEALLGDTQRRFRRVDKRRVKKPGRRRTCSGRMPFYGRDPRVPRRGIASLRMTALFVILRPSGRRIPVVGERAPASRCSTDGILACTGGGKYATAASGRGRERICGGEWERKEAR